MRIISIPIGFPNLSPQKYCKIRSPCSWNLSINCYFKAKKNNSLSRDQNSLLKLIDHPVDSLRILINWASSKTSTCFLIAGKVHQRSVSNALIDTHCLLKIRYLSMSTLVLLQKSFSKFIYPIYGLIKVASVL